MKTSLGRTRFDIPDDIYANIVLPIICSLLFYFLILPRVFELLNWEQSLPLQLLQTTLSIFVMILVRTIIRKRQNKQSNKPNPTSDNQ